MTQSDPLAMTMYAVAITLLIHHIPDQIMKQVWFADNASTGGHLQYIKNWWNNISQIGPEYGYFPDASNTWLTVKERNLEQAKQMFHGIGVVITPEGKRHFGSVIG